MSKLPKVSIQGTDGKWYMSQPMIATVKGGRAVIYVNDDGIEVKREPLARYRARAERKQASAKSSNLESSIVDAVEEIVCDIQDRRGLKHEWGRLDEVIQQEIKNSWVNIIKSKIAK